MAALMHLRRGSRAAAAALSGARTFSSTPTAGRKAAILGAAGGIGQPLGLLMKMNPYLEALSLYDIAGTPGVATDVSHINTKSIAKGYAGEEQLGEALEGCDIVIIPAGVPRKPGMTRDDLFKINASIVQGLVTACAKHCPNALLNIISNPVNSTVPIAAETLKKHSVYDPRKLFGVTTLDVIRARTFLARKIGADVADMDVPVIGGHAGKTILPLFSLATPQPSSPLSAEDVDALTKRTQDGGTEVVQAKAGKGSATLSMAYAGALFADACLRGLEGEQGVEEYSFVESTVTEVPFFSSKVILGRKGIEDVQKIPTGLTQYEEEAIKAAMPELRESIQKGVDFVNQNS